MTTQDDLARVESIAAEDMRFMATTAAGWSLRAKLEVLGVVLVVVAVVLAWALWPAPLVQEDISPAPAVHQADGSVVAERAPDAHSPAPPHTIPKGFHEVRREAVVVAPAPSASSVEVDLSLVSNGTEQRVVASSPDGQVIKAIDIPVQPVLMPAPTKAWAAGLSYDTRHAVGVWLDRDVGRLVVGAALSRLPDGKTEAQVRVGVRF